MGTWWFILGLVVFAILLAIVFPRLLLVRVPLWILCHTIYRLRVIGGVNVPGTGPALLVCNHVSHLDFAFILAGQKRHIHFVIFAGWTKVWGLRHLLKWAGVIPIDKGEGPRAIVKSLQQAGEALAHGEVVCIFAEGRFTRTGFLLPFHRGFEQIVKHHPAPIIPVCLEQVWGSIFSYRGGKLIWKWPQELPYPATVVYGEPMPATAKAFEVRQAIQKLSADAAIARVPSRGLVHREFLRRAARHPFRPCIFDPNADKPVLKYGETLTRAKILTRRLKPLLGDAPMVGVWVPPTAGGAIVNIALAFLGKTSVNLNYTNTTDIVQSAIRQCGIRHVLTSKLFAYKMPIDPGPGVELIYLEDFRKTVGRWERIRTFLGVLLLPAFIQDWLLGLGKHRPDDLATVIFSSGSTGEPKGVMLTHGNVAANAESTIQAINPVASDRLLGILPFFHSFGYTVTLWLPLQIGASTIFYANPLQAREIGELCKKHRATIFLSTPTFLRSYIKRCAADDFSSLRLLVCGAEKLPQAIAHDFQQKFGVTPLEGYGCTELSPVACVNVPDQDMDGFKQIGNKPGTIGQPIPGVAARIVHKDTFQDLPAGQEGLLLIYGANVMKGYLGKEELTRQKTRDGWYVTGDLAILDEDGFITITGREERFAKVAGEMVPLEKVEEELHAVLKSSERLCAVTAIPDVKKGERLIVLYLPLADVSVKDWWQKLQDRGLPNLFVPGQRDFFQVLELPILGSGKLDLKKCKQQALELAGPNGE